MRFRIISWQPPCGEPLALEGLEEPADLGRRDDQTAAGHRQGTWRRANWSSCQLDGGFGRGIWLAPDPIRTGTGTLGQETVTPWLLADASRHPVT